MGTVFFGRISVLTVKKPEDALSTIRARDEIKLVVTDLHMPEMNGIELQRRIDKEFNLPVISKNSQNAILFKYFCLQYNYC